MADAALMLRRRDPGGFWMFAGIGWHAIGAMLIARVAGMRGKRWCAIRDPNASALAIALVLHAG
jgi:hypothetical protein